MILKSHERARYSLEPYIPDFAGFATARGCRVLEVGVGMGADYLEWLKAGAQATGVDLSSVSLERARRRCEMAGFTPALTPPLPREHLPFADEMFDIVYSYGVMHHSPDTARLNFLSMAVSNPRPSQNHGLSPSFSDRVDVVVQVRRPARKVTAAIGIRPPRKSWDKDLYSVRSEVLDGLV